jgi:lipopolysaccharide export system permease protein
LYRTLPSIGENGKTPQPGLSQRAGSGYGKENHPGGCKALSRLDRYLLAQQMALFGFFALLLVSVYWINRAVMMFEQLLSDGQTARVVLEMTALTLPFVISMVLPVAAFAATVYTINRLTNESELVIMQATGISPWRLARPVLAFGLIVALLMALLVHLLVPVSRARLADRSAQIAENVSARFLTEGTFQHPAEGVTLYIREVTANGELLDLFLSDARPGANQITYTAKKALIARSAAGPKLIMFEGIAQSLRRSDGRLAVTRFADFTYDIGALIKTGAARQRQLFEFSSADLIANSTALGEETGKTSHQVRLELHQRVAQALMAPVATLLGFAALLQGAFSRFGALRQIGMAIIGLIAVQFLVNWMSAVALRMPQYWELTYVPVAFGATLVAALLWRAARSRRVARTGRTGPRQVPEAVT